MTIFQFPLDPNKIKDAFLIETLTVASVGGRRKRLFDIVFAIIALLSSAILFLVIAAAVKIASRGPVLYSHPRVGLGGQEFGCLKFRTMVMDGDDVLARHFAEDEGALLEYAAYRKLRNDPRVIAGIGHLLRKTSLDELPQFINVLWGEMSVVGPRPVTRAEIILYGEHEREVLTSRPGITGMWQISGRSDLDFDKRVDLDRTYVQRWSMGLDFRIILRTMSTLLTCRGAY